MQVFHVTPICNTPQIRARGVRPDLATGKRKASYWVDVKCLPWAIAHVANRHGLKVDRLVIFEADIPEEALKAMNLPGVFYCETLVQVLDKPAHSAGLWLRWIEEAQIDPETAGSSIVGPDGK